MKFILKISISGTNHRFLDNTREESRIQLYKTIAIVALLYASETCKLDKRDKKKIKADGMKFFKRTLISSIREREWMYYRRKKVIHSIRELKRLEATKKTFGSDVE